MTYSRPSSLLQNVRRFATLGILFAIIASAANAQVFRPFDPNVVALYTTAPIAGTTSSLAFTGSGLMEEDSVFYPVKRIAYENIDEWIEPDVVCGDIDFWGTAGMCALQNVPMWLGGEMRKTDSATYEYKTANGDVLVFNFGTEAGDSSTIFQSTDQTLLLISEGQNTYNHLDIEDSVYQYRLAHLNPQGVPLDTELHEAPITLGAQLGAIHFLRIDSFPQMAQPIVLAGHSGAEAGLYQIKEADVYDFLVGDEFQHSYYSNLSNPFNSEFFYESSTVVERTEDENDIFYTFDVHKFTTDSTINQLYETELTVSKTAVLVTFPLETSENEHPDLPSFSDQYHFQSLVFTPDSCMSEYTYSIEASFLLSCPQNGINCFGSYLHVAPGEWYSVPSELVLKQGIGTFYRSNGWSIVGGMSGSTKRRLVYSQKSGAECGDQVVLSTDDSEYWKSTYKAYPNPVQNTLHIALEEYVHDVEIALYSALGQKVFQSTYFNQKEIQLDISNFSDGVYFLKVSTTNFTNTLKLIKE